MTIAAFLLAIAASLPAAAHHGADAVITGSQSAPLATTAETVAGTIDELVVDNRVDGTTTRYTLLRRDDGIVVGLRGASAESLSKGTRVLATGRRAGDMLQVESLGVLSGPSPRAAVQSSASGQVQGTLLLAHADDFERNRSEFKMVVRGDDGRGTELRLGIMPDVLRTGMTVVAYGTASADNLSLDTARVEVLALPASPKVKTQDFSIQSLKTNNVLVLLVKFTDSAPADAFTPAQVQQVMVTNSNSVANYYSEVSYGQQALNVTVACLTASAGCTANTYSGGWLKGLDPTSKLAIATPLNCDYNSIHLAADTAATNAGINVANYSNRYYVFPYQSSCGWSGLAYVGYGEAYSNGSNTLGVYGHELGHNFGLLHAGSIRCAGQMPCTGGGVAEYGDPFDIMGNTNTGGSHFNAKQKSDILQWIPATAIKTHTTGTATYTLSPIESAGGASYAVKIPAAANRTYWVEYRQPIGFDSSLANYPNNGAQIRVSSPFESASGADDTEIIDMTPGTTTFTDAALLAGQSYTDTTYGVTITVGAASPTSLSVTVSMVAGSPTTTTLTSSANPSALGANVTFTASVTGVSPTGTVNFTDGGNTITGCGAIALSGSGNTRTAQCSSSALTAGTHSIAAAYGGGAGNSPSSSTALSQVVNKTTSTTAIVSSKNPSTFGASVSFTATVAGIAPTGSVNFKDGGSSIAGCSAVALAGSGNSRTATCTSSTLAVATHSIVASYAGDAGNTASNSATLSQVVSSAGPAPTTTTVASSLNPSTAGTSVTFTATVAGSNPTGSVNFKDGASSITGCSAIALTGSGNSKTAACSTSGLTAATHSITAAYAGDASNAASTSAALSQVVNSAGGSTNVALASNGGVASASSSYSAGFPVSAIINNERAGANWGNGGGWNDNTANAYPDWVQINFSGSKTIDHVVVYTVQDNYANPVEPTDTMTFSLYGVTAFTVQGWNGSTWVTLGSVSGNNLVKHTVNFSAYTTDRIRINVTAALASYSRITEVEAWGH